MKRLLFLALLSLSFACSFAQNNKPQAQGTKTLYAPKQIQYTPAPAGYQAVYINYAGRHGARHLTKDPARSFAFKALLKADSTGQLNDSGKNLLVQLQRLQKVEVKTLESISVSGAAELKNIAKRLYQNNKNVFKGTAPELLVATTKKGRTKESAEAFLTGFTQEDKKLTANVKFNYADDDNLRFYDFSPAYAQFKSTGDWKQAYLKLEKALGMEASRDQFAAKFFTAGFTAKWTAENKAGFMDDIYGFYTILDAVQAEIKAAGYTTEQVELKQFFTKNELQQLNKLSNAEDFLKKGPGMNHSGIQVKIAAPLLTDFINSTDAFLKAKPYAANLRFAHAETIAPFAALLDIKDASLSPSNVLDFEKYWKAENIAPFSANIQWIVYQSAGNQHYLVKCLLNEKEVAINGVTTKTFPYYSWESLRAHYLEKLKQLGLGLHDNAHEYLLKVK